PIGAASAASAQAKPAKDPLQDGEGQLQSIVVVVGLESLAAPTTTLGNQRSGGGVGVVAPTAEHAPDGLPSLAHHAARTALPLSAQDVIELRGNRSRQFVLEVTDHSLDRLIGLILADTGLLHHLIHQFIHVALLSAVEQSSASEARVRCFCA